MYNYKVWLKYTNREDNKIAKLQYLKNYLIYVNKRENNKKVGR